MSRHVSGLKVTMTPSDVVTEGQRVTLTCSTSCPLSEDITYMWFFNEQPLRLDGVYNKHVVINPVRRRHAGNYSCAIRTPQNINSAVETLTVRGNSRIGRVKVDFATMRNPLNQVSCAEIKQFVFIFSIDGDKTAIIAMNITKIVFLVLLPLVGCKLYLMLR